MIRTVIEDKTPQPTIQNIMETLKRTEKELDTKKKVISTNTSAMSEVALYAGLGKTHHWQAKRGRGRGLHRGSRNNFTTGSHFSNHRSIPYAIKYYNCGRVGHRAKDCQSSTSTQVCFNCGENNHYTDNCPHDTITKEQSRKGRTAYLA